MGEQHKRPLAPPAAPHARPHVSATGHPDSRVNRGLAYVAKPVTAGSKSVTSFMIVSQPGTAAASSVPEHRATHFVTFMNMIRILFSRVDPMVEPGPATQPGQVLGTSDITGTVATPPVLRDIRATYPQ